MRNNRAQISETISKEINDYTRLLIKNDIHPQKIILFGSYAKENPSEYSDIDLAIFSDEFGKDEIQEMMELKKLSIRVSNRIEPIPLSAKHLRDKYNPLIGEIKKYGKVVYEKQEGI